MIIWLSTVQKPRDKNSQDGEKTLLKDVKEH